MNMCNFMSLKNAIMTHFLILKKIKFEIRTWSEQGSKINCLDFPALPVWSIAVIWRGHHLGCFSNLVWVYTNVDDSKFSLFLFSNLYGLIYIYCCCKSWVNTFHPHFYLLLKIASWQCQVLRYLKGGKKDFFIKLLNYFSVGKFFPVCFHFFQLYVRSESSFL